MADPICHDCKLPKSKHCSFSHGPNPDCKCDPEWYPPNSVPPICASFEQEMGWACITCDHDKACHK